MSITENVHPTLIKALEPSGGPPCHTHPPIKNPVQLIQPVGKKAEKKRVRYPPPLVPFPANCLGPSKAPPAPSPKAPADWEAAAD